MPVTQDQALWFQDAFSKLVDNVDRAILGKRDIIELVVTAMLSEGHVLLEDFPGTGKTVLAKALANTLDGTHSRIQFTPDLLPSDVTGVTIYDQGKGQFEFHRGPIFASVVLADEINRASPKTQSALLEVMEEGRVTVDGVSYEVGSPFMVIATQNPVEQAGTTGVQPASARAALTSSIIRAISAAGSGVAAGMVGVAEGVLGAVPVQSEQTIRGRYALVSVAARAADRTMTRARASRLRPIRVRRFIVVGSPR